MGVLLSEVEPRLPVWSNRIWNAILAVTLAFSTWFFIAGPDNDWSWYPWSLLAVPVLVVAGARARLPDVATRVARLAGDLSYPVYALQGPLIWACAWIFGYFAVADAALRTGASLAAILALSAAALKFIDAPIRAWLTRRMKATR